MVTFAIRMALIAVAVATAALARAAEPDGAVDAALARGGYPWCESTHGKTSFRSVLPEKLGWLDWFLGLLVRFLAWLGQFFNWGGSVSVGQGVGNVLVTIVAAIGLGVLLALLLALWRRYEPEPTDEPALAARLARVSGRIEALPAGVRPETLDPWAEAVACRRRGDYARAIVCLFAHQLLTLDRRRLVRLTPGRTGRQLVRTIDDRPLRGCVEATLALFERVYYGHFVPSAEVFEAVWVMAEDFERRAAGGQNGLA